MNNFSGHVVVGLRLSFLHVVFSLALLVSFLPPSSEAVLRQPGRHHVLHLPGHEEQTAAGVGTDRAEEGGLLLE